MIDPQTLLRDATHRQRLAADPAASVWVAASAGTGKTKVLTDRVLSLLLAGTPPERILCLTFTKAAAAEMANRLAKVLAQWAILDDGGLTAALAALLGRTPDEGTRTAARRLFARVLDVPGGMRIETIHAFCQSLLRRFPLEAGLAPHFQVMDDRDAAELMEQAKETVLARAQAEGAEGDGDLARALAGVTERIHETAFPELMGELARDRGRLKRLFARRGDLAGVVAALRARLGLAAGESVAGLVAAACDERGFDGPGLRGAAKVLLAGKKTDSQRGAALAEWLAADGAGRAGGLAQYRLAFFTATGGPRASLMTKALAEAHPVVGAALAAETERLTRLEDRMRAAGLLEATAALLHLGQALLETYERGKSARAVMDYDDLILAARRLLDQEGAASWVLYKLDGGIDHVLVDEAQDTNPDQWAVVAALTGEFFAGAGARARTRTVFAVGDAKQSIYSFQRADPRAFEDMRHRYGALALAAKPPEGELAWREVPLNLSFRSVPAVLAAVDAVFADGQPGRDGVAGPGEDIRHDSSRQGQGGSVEVWPPVEPRAVDAPPPWKPPVERIRGDSPRTRLAGLVASRIAAMIGTETLVSKGRPVGAGDILVLVRRRGGFVEDLVRALKRLEVPVAGADRMVLAEQMAVMDLMALAGAILLPEDDLTLATVLKSPLVGLSEDQLFRLARGRGGEPLWDTLRRRLLDDPDFERAFLWLSDLRARADLLTPYGLFAHVLGPLGGKRRLLARLGAEAEDPLDEFMALALAFERARAPSLQGFLHWLETGAVEIKRDLDQGGRGAVRIMTVHGAKGLQAPIVFLPDTLQVPTRLNRVLWLGGEADEVPVWLPSVTQADPVAKEGRDRAVRARDQEMHRLLYVAMTRAEDRLIVCGWQTSQRAMPEGCWYGLIRGALAPLAAEIEDPFLAAQGETATARVLRLENRQSAPVSSASGADQGALAADPLPAWAAAPPPPEPVPPRPLVPSRPEGEEAPLRSPLATDDGASRFQRGRLIHRLLQALPDLAAEARSAAAARFLSAAAPDWSAAARLALAMEVTRVIEDPRFAPLFAPGSQGEVPVAARLGTRVLAGVVDRLAVTADAVLVADYKTNRRPPAPDEPIPPLYLRQMAAYRLALACLYPGRTIRCVLIWTDGPAVSELDPALLDDLLAGEGIAV